MAYSKWLKIKSSASIPLMKKISEREGIYRERRITRETKRETDRDKEREKETEKKTE